MTQPPLRNADLLPHPLRDYGWVSDVLPGKVGPTDIDFILERNGKVLILELKPEGVKPGIGQLLTLIALQKMGCEVYLVEGPQPNGYFRRSLLVSGNWIGIASETRTSLASFVRNWFLSA